LSLTAISVFFLDFNWVFTIDIDSPQYVSICIINTLIYKTASLSDQKIYLTHQYFIDSIAANPPRDIQLGGIMSPFEIRIALLREGVSMRSIARKLGVSPNSVSLVVNRRMVSRRIMSEIALAIKSELTGVFPEQFGKRR